jgi:hypothetical protein
MSLLLYWIFGFAFPIPGVVTGSTDDPQLFRGLMDPNLLAQASKALRKVEGGRRPSTARLLLYLMQGQSEAAQETSLSFKGCILSFAHARL